ncbi:MULTISPECIES: AAA family ATPase [Microbacterium]|uniref:AAA family ATPase n=1 Tax=Microbacterium TaxID=33882 RepID=UPI000C65DBAF|nr:MULTISPECIES: AAA family ATPase [Microbacterium]MAY49650.1 hypothetical protein [Microbacterium sp.]HAS31269.1 hypothetical protein [Microbacterium sp.]HBR88057.1 hypothetical protein [Microbacterium sp.]|tara:strand:+ start:4663 stop:5220 length:558 start_codon:yes stop_codon:yes gene_type:complete
MRIVVSGTHASGKSTLVSDFALRHPEFVVLPDPFELVDEAWDSPSAVLFAAQLRLSAARLHPNGTTESLIAERGPIDFLAYLLALDELNRAAASRELIEQSIDITREAMRHVDLLVVLPLDTGAGIFAPADEDLPLREVMNDVLLDLAADEEIAGAAMNVVEVTGGRNQRRAALEELITPAPPHP